MMNTSQGQPHALNPEISRLTSETNSSDRLAHQNWRRLRLQWDKQFKQRVPMPCRDKMSARVLSTSSVLENLQLFKENLRDSQRKTTGFLIAAYGSSFRPVTEWVEDQDNVITHDALEQQFGPLSEEGVDEVHVALLTLTEGGCFDIVLGAAPSCKAIWSQPR